MTTGKGVLIGVRCQKEFLRGVDGWRATQGEKISRPDAIRRLAQMGLALTDTSSGPRSDKNRAKAHELASTHLDKLIDPAMPTEERQQRKRRLLKGPKEFREMRDTASSQHKGTSK